MSRHHSPGSASTAAVAMSVYTLPGTGAEPELLPPPPRQPMVKLAR